MPDSASHRSGRVGWLRAAVLGANDGIISVASLVVGVGASGAPRHSILLTGIAGLVAGTVAMAAGEYVSVQSQADTEDADIQLEMRALELQPDREQDELTAIYMSRGLDQALAQRVAQTLMATDALGAHSRDELGITEAFRARPLQAALASAVSFSAGAMVPVATALIAPLSSVNIADGAHQPAPSWRDCGGGWGCVGRTRRDARRVLGRARHGSDGDGRQALWKCVMTGIVHAGVRGLVG
jgi:VIT1/CCC1 family predicted Fe2+/Mn2+ transporter